MSSHELRTLADRCWDRGQRDIAEALHALGRRAENGNRAAERQAFSPADKSAGEEAPPQPEHMERRTMTTIADDMRSIALELYRAALLPPAPGPVVESASAPLAPVVGPGLPAARAGELGTRLYDLAAELQQVEAGRRPAVPAVLYADPPTGRGETIDFGLIDRVRRAGALALALLVGLGAMWATPAEAQEIRRSPTVTMTVPLRLAPQAEEAQPEEEEPTVPLPTLKPPPLVWERLTINDCTATVKAMEAAQAMRPTAWVLLRDGSVGQLLRDAEMDAAPKKQAWLVLLHGRTVKKGLGFTCIVASGKGLPRPRAAGA